MTDWRQRKRLNILLLVIAGLLVICLIQLGNWQMRRLDWKNNLIQAVESRAFGPAVPAPNDNEWPNITADTHNYLRVKANGEFLFDDEIPVKAVTELGGGYWLLTPLHLTDGEIIWINRGFMPPNQQETDTRQADFHGQIEVTGLLRLTEPGGTIFEANDPNAGRWYSRDVDAFSQHTNLPTPAPYFIDADQIGEPTEWPRGGLTIIKFRNNHFQYAMTWYVMALALTAGMIYLTWLARRGPKDDDG